MSEDVPAGFCFFVAKCSLELLGVLSQLGDLHRCADKLIFDRPSLASANHGIHFMRHDAKQLVPAVYFFHISFDA